MKGDNSMVYSNPIIWRDKIALLFNTIPLKLKELDELKNKEENTVEIEAEIFGLMMACELYSFAISHAQDNETLKEEVRIIRNKASFPLFGRCADGQSEKFVDPFEMIRTHYKSIVHMGHTEVLKKLGEIK